MTFQKNKLLPGLFEVVFTEPGPIGLVFGADSNEGSPWIKQIKPGTQAAAQMKLQADQYLRVVAGREVRTFEEAMAVIRQSKQQRPLAMTFEIQANVGARTPISGQQTPGADGLQTPATLPPRSPNGTPPFYDGNARVGSAQKNRDSPEIEILSPPVRFTTVEKCMVRAELDPYSESVLKLPKGAVVFASERAYLGKYLVRIKCEQGWLSCNRLDATGQWVAHCVQSGVLDSLSEGPAGPEEGRPK
jgi:hypothetical protein